jgi:hypothetical protein
VLLRLFVRPGRSAWPGRKNVRRYAEPAVGSLPRMKVRHPRAASSMPQLLTVLPPSTHARAVARTALSAQLRETPAPALSRGRGQTLASPFGSRPLVARSRSCPRMTPVAFHPGGRYAGAMHTLPRSASTEGDA